MKHIDTGPLRQANREMLPLFRIVNDEGKLGILLRSAKEEYLCD